MQNFYDQLADDYHLVYADWDASMRRQAAIIKELIQKYLPQASGTILDCTCGIGTQSLGLAQLGYMVTGTDLSPASIARAKREARLRKLDIQFEAVDVRKLASTVAGTFDVVISFDNSLPHLTEPSDLLTAAQNINSKLAPGGLFLASIRDYDAILPQRPTSTQPVIRSHDGQRTISFQVWDWEKEDLYTVNHFTLVGASDTYETRVRKARYRAWTRQAMGQVFQKAGLEPIQWFMPETTGFYQPILVGQKPHSGK